MAFTKAAAVATNHGSGVATNHGNGVATNHGTGLLQITAAGLLQITAAVATNHGSSCANHGSGVATNHGSGVATNHGSGVDKIMAAVATNHGSGCYKSRQSLVQITAPSGYNVCRNRFVESSCGRSGLNRCGFRVPNTNHGIPRQITVAVTPNHGIDFAAVAAIFGGCVSFSFRLFPFPSLCVALLFRLCLSTLSPLLSPCSPARFPSPLSSPAYASLLSPPSLPLCSHANTPCMHRRAH